MGSNDLCPQIVYLRRELCRSCSTPGMDRRASGAGLALLELDQSRHVLCLLPGWLLGLLKAPESDGGEGSPGAGVQVGGERGQRPCPPRAVTSQLPCLLYSGTCSPTFSALGGPEGPQGSRGPDCALGAVRPEAPQRSPAPRAPLYLNVCEIPALAHPRLQQ